MYSIEPLEGRIVLVRFGQEHEKYGDPYDGTVIIEIKGESGVIKGLTKMPQKSWVSALYKELQEKYDLKKVTYERIKECGRTKNIDL